MGHSGLVPESIDVAAAYPGPLSWSWVPGQARNDKAAPLDAATKPQRFSVLIETEFSRMSALLSFDECAASTTIDLNVV